MKNDPLAVLVKPHAVIQRMRDLEVLAPALTFKPDPKRLKHKGPWAIELANGVVVNRRFGDPMEAWKWALHNYKGRFHPNGKAKFSLVCLLAPHH